MSDSVYLGSRVGQLETGDVLDKISRINLNVDSDTYYTAGDDTGRALEVTCPWGTQAMADSILESIKDYNYTPYTATDALLDPATEIGDAVTVGGIYSVLVNLDTVFDRACAPSISAPESDEIDDEYPYESKDQREINRQLAQTRSLITKTAEEIQLLVESEIDALSSSLTIQIDSVTARVDGLEGEYTEVSTTLDGLTVTDSSGTTKIKGSSIETDTLYVNAANITGSLTIGQLPSDLATTSDIPQYTSELINNSGFQTTTGVTSIINGTVTTDYVNALGITAGSVSASNITAGTLQASSLQLDGLLRLRYGSTYFGFVGASTAGQYNGAVLTDSAGNNFFIATNGGARMSYNYGSEVNEIFVARGGCFSTSEMQVYSDRNLKNSITYDMGKYEKLFGMLKPCFYKLNGDGEDAKFRLGFVAQDIQEDLPDSGLTENDVAFLGSSNGLCTIGYGEIIPLNTWKIQQLEKRIEVLEGKSNG